VLKNYEPPRGAESTRGIYVREQILPSMIIHVYGRPYEVRGRQALARNPVISEWPSREKLESVNIRGAMIVRA
jgi:hypothetical protein